MHWYKVSHTDRRARLLADRHYSRQTPGATEFCPPGNKVVLIIPSACAAAAVWASQRPAPSTGIGRADGFNYWNNVIFRNETDIRSSDLILEALAITKYYWSDNMPADGFHTFVDPRKVRGVKVRGKKVHGFSFMKAGFELYPEITKSRKLLRWIYNREQLEALEPVMPLFEQMNFFSEIGLAS